MESGIGRSQDCCLKNVEFSELFIIMGFSFSMITQTATITNHRTLMDAVKTSCFADEE
jgi:hypothetical protein